MAMICQEELKAYEAVQNRVSVLRRALKDYTGSDKLYDGAPIGTWPEGTTAANQELAEIRSRLQKALEALPAARRALNQCYSYAGIEANEGYQTVNLGVLLEDSKDRDWMRTVLAHGSSLDYIIEPASVDGLFEFVLHLASQDKRIGFLVLMGHGSKAHAHIGGLRPYDIDIDTLRYRLTKAQEYHQEAQAEIASLEDKLAEAEDEAAKGFLSQQLAYARANLENVSFSLETLQTQLRTLESLAEAMDSDALIGLLNCHPASSTAGREMMRNLGKIFLEKRGGRVVGCEGRILTIHNKPLIAWLSGADDTVLYPLGKMREVVVRPSRCGVPCLHFERYGYCDNRRSKNGGPCWMHR
jgi:hypothetical protein